MSRERLGVLVLKDGTFVEGRGFGAEGVTRGEVVFNTSMEGYQEYLTDPSYRYQILMPTYPLIGNYGIDETSFESARVQAEGFIVGELCEKPSHVKSVKTLNTFLEEYGVPGIQGVDTRFLAKKIRVHGVIEGILKTPFDKKELPGLKEQASRLESISDKDLVELVSTKDVVRHDAGGKKTVALIDCGVKQSIIRGLVDRKVNVVQVPANMSASKILDLNPDGVVVSNGPGDPERVGYVVKTIRRICDEQVPLMGICLGNQLLSLAFGGKTFKLKFGHRGANQPVKDLSSRRCYITSQNHGFAVDSESLEGTELSVTHVNVNDGTVEGVRHESLPVFSVQYHPEAHPGPWDNYYLFDEFIKKLND
ncbi:MAG: glutamine-hydrolyzing carbamoyl-phosphate synthase small subunit [Candidatus Altiarchaeota archaeon]